MLVFRKVGVKRIQAAFNCSGRVQVQQCAGTQPSLSPTLATTATVDAPACSLPSLAHPLLIVINL
jgi:hypothetical protein